MTEKKGDSEALRATLPRTLGLNYLLGEATTRDALALFLSENSRLEIQKELSWPPQNEA